MTLVAPRRAAKFVGTGISRYSRDPQIHTSNWGMERRLAPLCQVLRAIRSECWDCVDAEMSKRTEIQERMENVPADANNS